VLQIAEKYHQPPQDVEHWDAYWFERAVELMAGESIDAKRRQKDFEKKARRR
jgi:hypothetical protein